MDPAQLAASRISVGEDTGPWRLTSRVSPGEGGRLNDLQGSDGFFAEHRDNVPTGRTQPCGESCMWGDYHLRELALGIQRLAKQGRI